MSESFLIPLPASCALFCGLLVTECLIAFSSAFGQSQTATTTLETLEREFTDPLTTLPQAFLKDSFSPVNYGTKVHTNQVVARAIIPRIPPNTLLPFVQLVRPTFSLVTVPVARGGTRTDFGDMQLFDLAYCLGHRRKRVSGSDWDRRSCFRPRPRSSLVKARGKRVPRVLQFIPAFRGC
jgi:hypothetical protein